MAFINSGGMRTSLEKGTIFFGDANSVLPFQNELIIFDIRGDKLLQAIESAISGSGPSLHHAGLKVTVDMRKPRNERILDVQIICRKCRIPVYEPLNLFQDYRVIAPDYVAYNTAAFKSFGRNHV